MSKEGFNPLDTVADSMRLKKPANLHKNISELSRGNEFR